MRGLLTVLSWKATTRRRPWVTSTASHKLEILSTTGHKQAVDNRFEYFILILTPYLHVFLRKMISTEVLQSYILRISLLPLKL